ncbi:branched-chain amino acid ABC transporter permease [Lysinibacillus sp. PLM2]|nr:branched-chain amino acid ABC transporter permease [Lysinibacillus sp. PLM2]
MLQDMLISLPQVLIDGLALGAVYAVVALGYTMVYGILQLINFAHGEIFMTGAYIGTALFILIMGMSWTGAIPQLIVFIIVLLISAGLVGLLGVGIERVAYRPLRNTPRLIPLITAIGISFILQDVVRFIAEMMNGSYILTGPSLFTGQVTIGFSSISSLFNDASFKISFIIMIVTAILMMVALDFFVNRTKWGTAIRAVSLDRETASLMSINVNKVISTTFFVGSALGGATGVLFAMQYGTIDPYIGFILGLKAFIAAVLGGIGNIRGAMIGGLLLGLMEMFAAANLTTLTGGILGAEYKDVFAFAILIIVLIFKPEGLLGKPTAEKV